MLPLFYGDDMKVLPICGEFYDAVIWGNGTQEPLILYEKR